ncbi:hypothetical protein Btru_078108 [Bulinus truncatus]|nr:hypothetical protein Btru_078108 [Bulinus truncatus]
MPDIRGIIPYIGGIMKYVGGIIQVCITLLPHDLYLSLAGLHRLTLTVTSSKYVNVKANRVYKVDKFEMYLFPPGAERKYVKYSTLNTNLNGIHQRPSTYMYCIHLTIYTITSKIDQLHRMKHMVQLSVLMVFMMSSQISSKFPIKDCDNPDKEFLIVFDCRRDMRDQIKQFSKMAIGYLRTGRNWNSLNVDYMVHTPNGLVKLNHKNSSELTASADGLEKNCSVDISMDNIFNTTRTFFTPKSNTIQVSFIMLGRNISTLADDQQSVESIADRQDKEPEVYRFFVIVTPDKRNFVVKNYILYTESFQATNLYAFFLKVCDANCTYNAIGYSVDDNFKSYYHFDLLNKTTLSYGEKLCHTNYNSYLLSLECMTELENLQKLNFTNNKRYGAINILVGLQGENDFSWASGNPFLVRSFIKWKSFIINNKKKCVVLRLVSKNDSDRYDVEWHAFNCDDDIDNVYIGCECHVAQPRDVDKAKYFIINGEKPSNSILPTQSLINNLKILFFSHEKIASSFLDPDTEAERAITVCNTTNVTYSDNLGNFMCQSENWNYTVIEISNNTVLKGFNNFVFTTKRIDENGNNEVSNASKYINSVEDQFNSTYYTKCDENNSSDVEPYAPRCIFSKFQNNIPLLECKYKINLLDCEDFNCSTGYFKCPRSYCIPLYQVNDGVKDCTRGEDENVIFKTNSPQCTGHMVLKSYDMCLETDIWNQSLSISDMLLASDYRLCCEVILGKNIAVEKCKAPSDAISTCQHLVGDTLKRVIIWIVGFITIFGNGFVLVYRLTWDSTKKHNTTQIFFVICLAVSDFVMGIYLVIIASADIYFRNEYVLNETDWRYGDICRFSGFLSTISSETSTFFICWITYDRYTAMKYHCGRYTMPKRLKYAAFLSSWILGFSLALIPAVYSEWEIYSSNGMCLALPLNTGHFKGWEYSFAVFVILNFVLFMFIAVGQVAIFFIIAKTRKNVNGSAHGNVCNREIAAAQKLALVACL